MNNLRLLTGLIGAALCGGGGCAYAQQTVLTLEDLYRSAEANSAQLRPYSDALEVSDREVSEARSKRLPDVSASLSFSFLGDGFTTKRNFSDYQKAPIPHFGNGLGINVEQPLYTGGAITAGIKMAELKSSAARFAEDLQRDNIRFALTGYYLDLYKYHNLRSVVSGNIELAEKMLADMRARHQQGLALQNDITRYELLVSNLELDKLKIDNIIVVLNNNLVQTAGLPSSTIVVPDSTILTHSFPTGSETYWQNEASANAPEIKLARSKVEICNNSEKLARSEMLPKIGLQAGWTIDGPILVEVPPINRNLSYWYVGLGVSYNLSSLYKGNKAVARSKASSVQAYDELIASKERLSMDVKADYVKYLEAYEELKTRTKGVELAERNYNIVSVRYTADMALISDLLDAANARLEAQQQLVNARINIIYQYYKLLFTTGRI